MGKSVQKNGTLQLESENLAFYFPRQKCKYMHMKKLIQYVLYLF